MKISSLLKGGIYEIRFGYTTKLGGYTTLMSDIPKLGERQWRYQYNEVCKLRAADQTGRS